MSPARHLHARPASCAPGVHQELSHRQALRMRARGGGTERTTGDWRAGWATWTYRIVPYHCASWALVRGAPLPREEGKPNLCLAHLQEGVDLDQENGGRDKVPCVGVEQEEVGGRPRRCADRGAAQPRARGRRHCTASAPTHAAMDGALTAARRGDQGKREGPQAAGLLGAEHERGCAARQGASRHKRTCSASPKPQLMERTSCTTAHT